jgi:serine/threonine protein kinase, bacterial
MIGTILKERYRVVRVLGSGGFSQTYLAEDTQRPGNPLCVVKQLKPASSDPFYLQTARRLFNEEANTLEKLGKHDQIPQLLAYFEENQEFYLIQEFIQGQPLSAEMQPGNRWNEQKVIRLLQEVLSILEFVHSQNVIHRDIKPDNIMRRQQDNKPVLIDFGAVKQIRTRMATAQGQSSATVPIGTPGYMPAEQGRGKPQLSSDIYSLGMAGIQALTGLAPNNLREDPQTGEVVWKPHAQVSAKLASILDKMVRYHFKDRYQSATDALQALQQLNTPRFATQRVAPAGYSLNRQAIPNQPPVLSTPPSNSPVLSSKQLATLGLTGLAMAVGIWVAVANGLSQKLSIPGSTPALTKSATPTNNCIVASLSSNVRSGPNGTVIGGVNQGDKLVATGKEQDGWIEISSPSSGWIFKDRTSNTCSSPSTPSAQSPYGGTQPEHRRTQSNPARPTPPSPPDCQDILVQADAVSDSDINEAIALAESIPQNSSCYPEAQQRAEQWKGIRFSIVCLGVLESAKAAAATGTADTLEEAINLAASIPQECPTSSEAQPLIGQWQADLDKIRTSSPGGFSETGTPGSGTPSGGVTAPSSGTGTPGSGTPSDGVTAPSPGIGTPGSGTPSDGVTAPSSGTETPGSGTPSDGVTAPSSGTGTPGSGTPSP